MKKYILCIALILTGINAFAENTDNIKLALNMYSNHRARKVGDLLTVTVSESTASSKKEDFKSAKDAKANAQSPYFGDHIAGASSLMSIFHNKLVLEKDKLPIPEYKIEASSGFTGSGETSSSESLTMTFTVRVVDILDNGVLVIRGDRRVLIRNESISMVMTGLVRQKDIDATNTVSSNRIADAHIYYETDGEVSRGARPGFVWRLFQFLNPF